MTSENKRLLYFILLILSGIPCFFCGCNADSAYTGRTETPNDLESQAHKIIENALTDNDPMLRAKAIEVVACIPANYARRFMPEVQQLLKDEFAPVRFAAAVATGDRKYTSASADVTRLIKDENHSVRLAADYAIFKLGGSDAAAKRILDAIESSDQQVRANAAFLLGKMGDRSVISVLYEAIKKETSDDRVRLNSIEAIARLGDDSIYEKLWATLISAYADDRVLGIQAMGALGTPSAQEAILTMLEDDLPEVRLVAAEQLGRLGNTSGEKVVVDALTQDIDEAPDIESKTRILTLAAQAIGQIKTTTLIKYLPELLKSESSFVKLAAAKAVLLSEK